MTRLLIIPATLAVIATFAGCGDGDSRAGVVKGAMHDCDSRGGIQALTDVGEGSYGRTSSFIAVCKDGTIVEVKD